MNALVVDDDPSWQEILSDILSDRGLRVEVAATLADALPRIRAQSHRFAVVDLSLCATDHTNQDGLSVLDALFRYDPRCISVLLTGFATVSVAVRVLTEGKAVTCLEKESFSKHQLDGLIQQAVVPRPPEASPSAAELRGRCLLVDDDAGWRDFLAEQLTDTGLTVRACGSFGEALGALRQGRWRLAVIDLSLAGSADGYRLLAATEEARIPTVVVTGTAAAEDIESTYARYRIVACLQKQTFDRSVFVRAVGDACESEIDTLTERELEVLGLVREGKTNKAIAAQLYISENTVKQHLKSIFEKLDVRTRAAAVDKISGR